MVTWADVVKWDIEPVLDARHQVQTAEGAMQNNGEVIERAHQDFSSEGLAAYAASTSLEEVFKDIDFVEAQLTDLLTALQSATSRLNELVRRVKGALDYAVDERLRILDDGTVEFTEQIWNDARAEAAHMPQPQPDPHGNYYPQLEGTLTYSRASAAKEQLEKEVSTILTSAKEIDRDLVMTCERIQDSRASKQSIDMSSGEFSSAHLAELLTGYKTPSEIRALWDALSPHEQQLLVADYPKLVGSTNGIPFHIRGAVNEQLAANRAKELDKRAAALDEEIGKLEEGTSEYLLLLRDKVLLRDKEKLEAERDYLIKIVDSPERTFILFEPENNRIIEQNGTLSKFTTELYTHVPGTDTSYNSFIDGSATAFPRSVVEVTPKTDPNDKVSSFTFMDGNFEGEGAWIEWGTGERGNANANHLQAKGESLNSFQDAVAVEAANIGADINIGGHSAGQSVVFSSENFGAWYDQVNSLSGSYAPGDWKPNASTSYDHYYYKPEPLNMFGIGSAPSPMNVEAFEKHAYDGTDPLSNHARTNTDITNNHPLIKDLIHEIQSN